MGKARKKPANKSSQWTLNDRLDLLAFLYAYKDAATAVYHGRASSFPTTTAPFVVGGIDFPILSSRIVRQRFLALPVELTSKQRKMLHECCVETFLYHGTIEKEGVRQVLISIYADGMPVDSRRQQQQVSSTALYMYRPWFCGNNKDSNEQTRAIEYIAALMDQPSRCIRECDVLNIEKLDTISVPPPVHENVLLVDSYAKMTQMKHEWSEHRPSLIAFDVEAYNESKYCQLTCLLQISVPSRDESQQRHYIIDPVTVWNEIGPALAPYFADPSIVKIGHAVGGLDVPCLYRDFGIVVVNVFDTYEAAQQLRLPVKGLAAVCEYYKLLSSGNGFDHYKTLKEQYQSCDWRVRPLTEPMVQYGRFDINYLMPLRELMIRDLTRDAWAYQENQSHLVAVALAETLKHFNDEDGENELVVSSSPRQMNGTNTTARGIHQSMISLKTSVSDEENSKKGCTDITESAGKNDFVSSVGPRKLLNASELRMQIDLGRTLAMSQQHCKKVWRGRSEPRMKTLDLMVQRLRRHPKIRWTASQNELYIQLADWRDAVAAALETLPQFIASLEYLAAVAYQRPCTEVGLRRISSTLPHAIEDNKEIREQLLDIVRKSVSTIDKDVRHEECYFYKVNKFRQLDHERLAREWKWPIAAAVVLASAVIITSGRRRSR